jgi:hypothetical protein
MNHPMGLHIAKLHLEHLRENASVTPFQESQNLFLERSLGSFPFQPKESRMKTIASFTTILLVVIALFITTKAQEVPVSDASFQEFLAGFENGTSGFMNGDNTLWKENASHSSTATIMGSWGAYEKGWHEEVNARYDWAAARFLESGAKIDVEYLSKVVGGDMAYTVAIERSTALIIGQDKPAPLALRVTHIYMKEDGIWKLVHRHADPLLEKTAPAAVLQEGN